MRSSRTDDDRVRRERRVLKAAELRATHEPVVVHAPPIAPGGATVSVVTRGDRVALIEVRCKCGEVVVLECAYGDAPDTEPKRRIE